MRVLVIEDSAGASTDVILDLMAVGHEVRRCQPLIGEVSPCVGFTGFAPECPLSTPVDVVVQIHDGVRDLTARELGAVCAERIGIPIINIGRSHSALATLSTSRDQLLRVVAAFDPAPGLDGASAT